MSSPKIQNIVSTLSLKTNGQKLDLRAITNRLLITEYRPERFSAMIMRIKEPVPAVALLFSTGRLVCVGTKSLPESRTAIGHMAQLISEAAQLESVAGDLDAAEFRVRNMVASFSMLGGSKLNLQTLYNGLRAPKPDWLQHCSYNPELFPGMCLRMRQREGIVILVFSSGKCVITGAHNGEEIQETFQTVYATLEKHVK